LFSQGTPGTFANTGSMSVPRQLASATLISGCNCPADGKVLVVGGVIDGNTLATNTADLYDPTTGTFTPTGNMNIARGGHAAALLSGGKILIVGAFDSPGPFDAEVYDPVAGTFSCVAGIDPATGYCNPTLVHNAGAITATALQNGTVLITGLPTPTSGGQYSTGAVIFDPSQSTFACVSGMSATANICNPSMVAQHFSGTATLLANGKVLIAGGSDRNAASLANSAELYDPTIPPNGSFAPTGGLVTARVNHAAVLLKTGEVLIVGGGGNSSNLNSAEVYANGVFTSVGNMAHVRVYPDATLLSDGTVLVTGGCCEVSNVQLASAEIYNPATKTFALTGDMNEARATHTATLLPNGQVLVAGGFQSATAELYTPVAGSTSPWIHFSLQGGGPFLNSTPIVYDPTSNRLIVFGGYASGPCCVGLNDTWVLANANGIGGTPQWQQLATSGPLPPGRVAQSAVYDAANNRMIIFGGGVLSSSGLYAIRYNDVWVLANANGLGGTPSWTELSPTGAPPVAREGAKATYDPATNRMTIFGGGNNGIMDIPNDTWVLTNANGLTGTPQWIQLSPTGNLPAPREVFVSTYDQAANAMTVFGGCCPFNGDLWVLSGANGIGPSSWQSIVQSSPSPGTLVNWNYGYDAPTESLLFFGGGPSFGVFRNDFWVLANANGVGAPTWTNPIPNNAAGSPPAGIPLGTYDPVRKRYMIVPDAANLWVLDVSGFLGSSGSGGPPATHTLTVSSTNPSSGVPVSVSLLDNNNLSGGNTPFALTYNDGAVVMLNAPTTTSGNNFSSWTGCDAVSGTTCTVTITGDRAVTTNYVTPPPPPTGIINVSTNTASATYTISGPTTFSGVGVSSTFPGVPAGDYTIKYGPDCRSDLPATITLTLSPGGTIAFVGTYAPGFLKVFPLAGLDPCAATINAVFDHSQKAPYSNDFKVVAYTGETGLCDLQNSFQDFQSVVGVKHPHSGYRNQSGSVFAVNGHYTGGENGQGSPTLTCAGSPASNLPSNTFLFYDGHPGYDYKATCGTPVYAAVSGTVVYPSSIPGLNNAAMFHVLELDPDAPDSSYKLYYLHLSTYPGKKYPSCDSAPPIIPRSCNGKRCHVNAGQLIGMSGDAGVPGSPHLHFEIQVRPGIPVDPYGWKGTAGADPYAKRAISINLWP
jgi:hypothetical protein